MSQIIVLRTHYYDESVDRLVLQMLSVAPGRVYAVVDERKGVVTLPDYVKKIALSPTEQGVVAHPDYGWRCGDYALYAALLAVPEATDFWIIEPDVRIHSNRVEDLFIGQDSTKEADFVTAWFVRASPEWVWYKTISPFISQPFNTMLQLYRISRRAATYLYEQRQLLGTLFAAQKLGYDDWPNDEAFMGAVLPLGEFRIATFKQHAPAFHTAGIFTFTQPTSARWLDKQPPDNGIYHPVASGAKFIARAQIVVDEMSRKPMAPGSPELAIVAALKEQMLLERASASPPAPAAAPNSAADGRNALIAGAGRAGPATRDDVRTWAGKSVAVRSWNKIRNNGDALSAILVDKIFDGRPFLAKETEPHLLGVGSIFFMANRHSTIWGSGVLNRSAHLPEIKATQIRALRGKLSADFLVEKGNAVPDIAFGDPGILVDHLVQHSVKVAPPKYRIAVIPHHDSAQHPFFAALAGRDDICLVDMLDDGLTPIEQVAQSEIVLSQSLHGLVYAESLGKPSLWITTRSDDIWNFKFNDWFSTTANPQRTPVMMDRAVDTMLAQAELRQSTIRKSDLLAAFPTELFFDDPRRLFGYADCRLASPAFFFFASPAIEATTDFSPDRDLPRLAQLDSEVRPLARKMFRGWAEPPYSFASSVDAPLMPTPAQAGEILAALDERSSIDFAFLVPEPATLPAGASVIALGHGVKLYRGYKALGLTLCLRPSLDRLGDNFIVFSLPA